MQKYEMASNTAYQKSGEINHFSGLSPAAVSGIAAECIRPVCGNSE